MTDDMRNSLDKRSCAQCNLFICC